MRAQGVGVFSESSPDGALPAMADGNAGTWVPVLHGGQDEPGAAPEAEAGAGAASLAWGVWAHASGITGQLTDAGPPRLRRGDAERLTTERGLAVGALACPIAAVAVAVAVALGHAGPGDIDPQLAFHDMGIDSLTALESRNRLAGEKGPSLPATLVFDHPTPAELARHRCPEIFAHVVVNRRSSPSSSSWNRSSLRYPRLESASADEVFDFIAKELGVS